MNHQETENLTPAMKQTILALLRSALWGRERFPFQPPRDTDWQAVYTELQHQAIQHLCVDLLAAADPANTFVYIQNLSENIRKWHRIMECQQELTDKLARESIPCVVLKGAAAARYYPQPEYRCMGDIDLIVRPEDFDRTLALFQPPWKIIGENHRHIDIRNSQALVELHRIFSTFRSPELCRFLDDAIFEGIAQAQTVPLERFTFPCLPRKLNGLVLLTHINIHMELGLGFRQMVDWMMYVDRELDDEFWQTEFSAAARSLGLEKLAVTVTRMCQLYLGLREDITWCRHADEDLCAELLEHTFRQGNFGRKTPERHNTAIGVLSAAKNIPGFFRALQRRGLYNWPAARNHRILRPFAWLYQIIRYIRLGLKQKYPIRFFLHALTAEKKQGSLLDRLEVTRMNK
jgi:hypothetical protein